MSDDAQAPGTPQDTAASPWVPPGTGTDPALGSRGAESGQASGAPGAPAGQAPGALAGWTPGAPGAPGGQVPGVTAGRIPPPGASDGQAPKVPLDKPTTDPYPAADPWAPPTSTDPRPAPDPWAPPTGHAPAQGSAFPAAGTSVGPRDTAVCGTPSVHDQPTVVAMQGSGAPSAAAPGPWNNPFAPPGPAPMAPGNPVGPPTASGNPFAPPTDGQPVPPPPLAPEGPGQLPYGYPAYPGYPGYVTPYGPQSGVPGYGWPWMPLQPSNGMGTASLVLGIISAVIFCLWPVAMIVGVLAVIFGVIGRRKAHRGEATNGGMALAGLICGAAGFVLGAVLLIVVIATQGSSDAPRNGTDDGYSTSLVANRPR